MIKKNLSLDEIFLKDDRFRISYYFSLEKLILSLKRIGLINPPLVNFRSSRFILVSGWKRVLACEEISLSPIPVNVIEEEDELKNFLMAFHENMATREFSLLEKAEILSKLKKFGESEKEIVRHYLPLLKISSNLSYYDTYLTFSQFDPEIKKVIHEKNMPFASVEMLAEFRTQELRLLLPLILPLGQNKQKEVLEDIQEISRKDDIPAEKILKSKEIQDILNSEILSPLQKANKIRLLLRRKRYPRLSSYREAFNSSLKEMHWPQEIVLQPSSFFEEKNITVTFDFKNEKEFRTRLLNLQNFASKKEFSKLFKPFSDD